uniref:V-SNARE coiled-coil homology domain-containing protein n=1 Tax=Paramoeba aestuarina TaxID=180227 RepID=A0A7S4U7P2_9EUKA|mmetsp:Transcript_5301/g.7978  ORF Transcript_5301/g.7978 Transcript_5301/m.7978 type:complete len:215 (+) Transcript_5301:87-731(+)
MAMLTLIARASDGLLLCGNIHDHEEMDALNRKAKMLLKKIAPSSPKELCIECSPYYFMYLLDDTVCFLSLFKEDCPKHLAHSFLSDIRKEFVALYQREVMSASRPYQMIKFDPFIERTKKIYENPATTSLSKKVSGDLADIHRTMTQNLSDILERGEKLNSVSMKSEALTQQSKKYEQSARNMRMTAIWKKRIMYLSVIFVILLFLFLRFYWFA